MVSLLDWKRWPEARPYFFITVYARDDGRPRVEVRQIPDQGLRDALLAHRVSCPRCGNLHHPVRVRKDGSMYYAASCPLEVKIGCARSKKASDEFKAVVADVRCTKGG